MESAAVARVAASAGLPFLVVRAVADHAGMSLPAAVLHALDGRGDVALPRLLGYAIRQPAQFVELARLGRAFGAAAATLRRVRALAGDDLCLQAEANRDHSTY
jgi:adenosylhomocysteine nucleosidase